MWPVGVMVSALDSEPKGTGFESQTEEIFLLKNKLCLMASIGDQFSRLGCRTIM